MGWRSGGGLQVICGSLSGGRFGNRRVRLGGSGGKTTHCMAESFKHRAAV